MRRARFVLLAFATAFAVALIAAGPASAATTVIDAHDDSPGARWEPANVTVDRGDTVRWEFDVAQTSHNVKSTSSNWSLDSGSKAPGSAPTEFTFDTPGTYTFLCQIHPGTMTGSVTVEDGAPAEPLENVLVFSKTAGFRHDSIDEGIAAIEQLGAENDFAVDATEDGAAFTDANLAQYDVVVFLSTTGDVLDATQQAAFERFIQAGNGYVGVHAAADTEYTWPWYGEMLGGYFRNHPAGTPTAAIDIEDGDEPSTTGLPARWTRTDEWYNFQNPVNPSVGGGGTDYSPRDSGVHVLATIDESTYDEDDGNTADDDHPVAWCSQFDGGRVWYTALGHTAESFGTGEGNIRSHLLGGLRTAAGVPSDCGDPREASPSASDFEKVTINDDTENPMELDIAPDGRVFFIERDGRVMIWDPEGGQTTTAGMIPVTQSQENGLLGIQLAPDFATTGHIFLTYSALPDSSNQQRVSRFTVEDDAIVAGSEQVIYTWQHQRAQCCHSSGSLAFAPDGSLYISTGDNTNPFDSGGFAPIDERLGREAWDAQRSSANTNNANGKILHIVPKPDAAGGARDRDDVRDPGRQPVPGRDRPDAARDLRDGLPQPVPDHRRPEDRLGADGRLRPRRPDDRPEPRPAGQRRVQRRQGGRQLWLALLRPPERRLQRLRLRDEPVRAEVQLRRPGQHLAEQHGPDQPPAGKGGDDVDGLLGDRHALPGARHRRRADRRPALRLRRRARRPRRSSPSSTTASGSSASGTTAGSRPPRSTTRAPRPRVSCFVTCANTFPGGGYLRPMDMEFGPDGSLYVIEWGSGFGGNNADSGIYRIDYIKGARKPIAHAAADPDSGPLPLEVAFSSAGSIDPEGTSLTYEWDFDGDGDTDSTDPNPTHTYATAGTFSAKLTVTDQSGMTGTDTVPIIAGNTRPEVTIEIPENGKVAQFGDIVPYRITVTDAEDGSTEDGTIDCDDVTLNVSLGHDQHAHELSEQQGCEGTFRTETDGGHGAEANIFTVIEATYTDAGAGAAGAITGRDEAILQPKLKQAEYWAQTGRTADGRGTGDPGVPRRRPRPTPAAARRPRSSRTATGSRSRRTTSRTSTRSRSAWPRRARGAPSSCTTTRLTARSSPPRRTSRRPAAGRRGRTSTSTCPTTCPRARTSCSSCSGTRPRPAR